jgi:hypothetical protein
LENNCLTSVKVSKLRDERISFVSNLESSIDSDLPMPEEAPVIQITLFFKFIWEIFYWKNNQLNCIFGLIVKM